MTLAMARPWKHPKTGVYWLRKRVPADLQKKVGRSELRRSLGTKDPTQAKIALARQLADVEQTWANLRRGRQSLTEQQAHDLARPVFERWWKQYREKPSEQRFWKTEAGVRAVWEMPPEIFPAHLIPFYDQAPAMQRHFLNIADELLQNAGLEVDEPSRLRLARAASAAIHRASVALEQHELGYELGPEALALETRVGSPKSHQLSFDVLLADWRREKRPTAKTSYEWGRVMRQLGEYLGHEDASSVMSADLNRWKGALLEAGLKAKTIRDAKIAPVRAIFQVAVDNEKLAKNPASRVVIDAKTRPSERKRGYTDEEANKL